MFHRRCQSGAFLVPGIYARGGSTDNNNNNNAVAADEPSIARGKRSQTVQQQQQQQRGAKTSEMTALSGAGKAVQDMEIPGPQARDGDAALPAEGDAAPVVRVAGGIAAPASDGRQVGDNNSGGFGDVDAGGAAAAASAAAAVAPAAAAGAGKNKQSAHLKLRTMHLGRDDAAVEQDRTEQMQPQDGNPVVVALERVASGVDQSESATEGRGAPPAGLPPGTVWLLDYRPPPPPLGESRGVDRFASLGGDASKFAIFLDSAVARGELEPPPPPVPPIPGAAADVGRGEAARAEARRGEGVALAGAPPFMSVEDGARQEDREVDTRDPQHAAVAAGGRGAGAKGKGEGLPEPKPAAEAKPVAAIDAACAIASGGGRWATRITASTLEVTDEGAKESLQALWKQGRMLSQEGDATNVLRGEEVRGEKV